MKVSQALSNPLRGRAYTIREAHNITGARTVPQHQGANQLAELLKGLDMPSDMH